MKELLSMKNQNIWLNNKLKKKKKGKKYKKNQIKI